MDGTTPNDNGGQEVAKDAGTNPTGETEESSLTPDSKTPVQDELKKKAKAKGLFGIQMEPESHFEKLKPEADHADPKKNTTHADTGAAPAEETKEEDQRPGEAEEKGAFQALSQSLRSGVSFVKKSLTEALSQIKITAPQLLGPKQFDNRTQEFISTDKCPICSVKYKFLDRVIYPDGTNKVEKELRIRKHLSDHVMRRFQL